MSDALAADAAPLSSGGILQELRSFQELGSVLFVAAHPDDEDTQLITYLARGRGARTAYLSITRGDGGQNLIGADLSESLGVLRTQELLAARRIDGGQQFFTRARDFGFSKDYAETLSIWNREQVLADVVHVIRRFRPDVIITAFSLQPGGTHGHHTASAMLAVDAFKLAGDPKFSDPLPPWQPKRVLQNIRMGRAGAEPTSLQLDVGGFSALLGESYGEISARSRSMHKTQGFGTLPSRGENLRSFKLLAGDPATNTIFDGVATDWNRIPGGGEIDRLTAKAVADFKPLAPGASVPALLAIRGKLAALPSDALVNDKRKQLDRILRGCLGLYLETTVESGTAVPGETLQLKHTVIARSGVPVRWTDVRYPALNTKVDTGIDLPPNQLKTVQSTAVLPANTPLSQPYWLRRAGTTGMFNVEDASLVGDAENPPVFTVEHTFEIGGQTLTFAGEPVEVIRDAADGEIRRPLQAVAPVVLEFSDSVQLFAPGSTRQVALSIRAVRANMSGRVQIEAPAGWQVSPAAQEFKLGQIGDSTQLNFKITAPSKHATASFGAVATLGSVQYRSRRIELHYAHLSDQLLQPPATLKALSMELNVRGKTIGYIAGPGDDTAQSLERMGYAVTQLTNIDMNPQRLRGFDAVVIGVRALGSRPELSAQLPTLVAYAQGGGTVVMQYQRENIGALQSALGFQVSGDRVTDERAAITLLAPDHPALNTPNKIGPADFEGWVQERGLQFASQWDARYTPLIACNDPGEPPKSGGLLVGREGKGYIVYAPLAFFRQLPEGVPGAYRLFANLVSLGR